MEAVNAVAAHQHGVITFAQLTALGFGRGRIESWVRSGRLHRVHRGVYVVGTPSPAVLAPDLAAVLACGGGAYLSHEHSLALDGLIRAADERHVTVVGRDIDVAGVRTHTACLLDRRDTRISRGIPATSVARALVEVAGTHSPEAVADAVERAQVKRLVTHEALAAAVDRAGRRKGGATIRAILSMPQFTRSRAERMVLRLCRQAGLPLPETNEIVGGDEVDFLWPRQAVTLEFDSYAFHASRAAFERDRERDARRQRAGFVQLRTTWWELNDRPFELVARLAEALARRRRGAAA